MDYFCLLAATHELKSILQGGLIRHCQQPRDRTLTLSISGKNQKDHLICFETTGYSPGLFLETESPSSAGSQTPLARSFRNKIVNSRIQNILMPYPDRIVVFELNSHEWSTPRQLVFELMGNSGNVICVDQGSGKILECLTKTSLSHQIHSPRSPGFDYLPGHIQEGLNLIECDSPEIITEYCRGLEYDWRKLLNQIIPGTPELSKSICKLAADGKKEALSKILETVRLAHEGDGFTPIIFPRCQRWDLQVLNFAEIPSNSRRYESILIAADAWRKLNRSSIEYCRELNRMRAPLVSALTKIRRNIAAAERDLNHLENPEKIRQNADLLTANFHFIKPGMNAIEVTNFYDSAQKTIVVKIDASIPIQNYINKLFRRAGKLERALPAIQNRIQTLQTEAEKLQSWISQIEHAKNIDDLQTLQEKLYDAGFSGPAEGISAKRAPESPQMKAFHIFRTDSGWDICVGKGAKSNDYLTFKFSGSNDFWFHADRFRGAHIVVKNPNRVKALPDDVKKLAASLAVFFSKARGEKGVPVKFTLRKHVRRVSGGKAGLALVMKHATIQADSPQLDALPLKRMN